MSMGSKKRKQQGEMWIDAGLLPNAPAHPFYSKLDELLERNGFTAFVEAECAQYYADDLGRPSIPPPVHFKMLFIGFFEGIDSERGIAWRVADSVGLRQFLGYELTEGTPDHSSLSRTRRLMSSETHEKVFTWVLGILAGENLVKGKTLGIDATTLEANAAMRSIVRRDTGEGYEEFLTGLAKTSGIETPTREDLAKLDRTRKNKASNRDWEHPFDPDARIAKMKDGSTHMAHKAEHAVDMDTGALIAVTLQHADMGDTETVLETLVQAGENLASADLIEEDTTVNAVMDKGYHSNDTLALLDGVGVRGYISEPDRGRRNWKDDEKKEARRCVYGNRRRIRGEHGKVLMRKRGEMVERTFAHMYETGAMRRTHLRGHENILKRLVIHAGGFNLSLVMRKMFGFGKPRRLQDGYHAEGVALHTSCDAIWVFVLRFLGAKNVARSNWTHTPPIEQAAQAA